MRYFTGAALRPEKGHRPTAGRILSVLCCAAVATSLASCDTGGGPDPIETGVWSATIASGLTGTFTLGGDPLALTEVHFVFNEWSCGPITYNGQVTISTNVQIQGRDIDLTAQWGVDNDRIRFIGEFADSGDEAHGTWTGTVYWDTTPYTCSGSWSASH